MGPGPFETTMDHRIGCQENLQKTSVCTTVDGRNPAPPWMVKTL